MAFPMDRTERELRPQSRSSREGCGEPRPCLWQGKGLAGTSADGGGAPEALNARPSNFNGQEWGRQITQNRSVMIGPELLNYNKIWGKKTPAHSAISSF